MVTFATDIDKPNNNHSRSSILGEDDVSGDLVSSDQLQSAEFRGLYGSTNTYPTIEKSFSYKVVDRLSKWEGGKTNPYQNPQHSGEEDKVETVEPETITFLEFLRQFCHPSYDLTEVSVEDIDRTKIMHDRFLGQSQFDFNYTTLLIIASVIAAMGLGSDSVASIIASMLVSPLMGPVTAIAYGISIGDYKMVRMGLVTEVVSLIICIVIGLIFAGAMLPFKVALDWPVEQMSSRGTMTNFWVGFPIAFFSGLGVAVGILDDQTNSLVGVAISASLLPPAVNAGMLWVIELHEKENGDYEYATAGLISLGLTIANIVLIIIASMIMFRLKETLPIEKSIFWTDLGIARKIYHNVAILPNMQHAPDDAEIKKRVTTFFPRASAMIFAADFNPVTSANNSGSVSSHNFSADSSFNSRQKYNANYQWAKSSSRNTTGKDNSGKDDSSKDNSGKRFRDITSLDNITENTA